MPLPYMPSMRRVSSRFSRHAARILRDGIGYERRFPRLFIHASGSERDIIVSCLTAGMHADDESILIPRHDTLSIFTSLYTQLRLAAPLADYHIRVRGVVRGATLRFQPRQASSATPA